MAAFGATVTPCSTSHVVQLAGSGKCMAEYIWIGSTGADLKSRTVVLDGKPSSAEDLPIAEIDGSSYGQASEESCEIYLQPRKIFPDPFRGGDHILVLCDIFVPPMAPAQPATATAGANAWDNLQPHSSNHRAACEAVMHSAAYQQPLFSMQQDYSLYSGGETFEGHTTAGMGLGGSFGGAASGPSTAMPIKGLPAGLSAKASARLGRDVAELHMHACLAAGLSYCGSHSSGGTHWAYKVGPCHGIDAADQLCMSRFLLARVAEHSGAGVCYDGDGRYSSSSFSNKCTISFSTASSRDPVSGLSEVQCMMERLHSNHMQHAVCFSDDSSPAATDESDGGAAPNHHHHSGGSGGGGSWHSAHDAFGVAAAADDKQASGNNSPASGGSCGSGFSGFTVGVGNKHASIMVPTSTLINRCGPILDRRPPASSDPYLAIMLLVTSACGIKLPVPQLNAAQLAAALASAAAGGSSGAMAIPAGGAAAAAAGSVRCSMGCSYEDSLGPTCSYGSSMLCSGSADSRDVLLSELDRLDGYHHNCYSNSGKDCAAAAGAGASQAHSRGMKRAHSGPYCQHGRDNDVCSDASSPPVMSGHLAAAGFASYGGM